MLHFSRIEFPARVSDRFLIYHLAVMHITALVILISWVYTLASLSETSFSFSIFHRFLGFFQPRDSPDSPYCSFFSRGLLFSSPSFYSVFVLFPFVFASPSLFFSPSSELNILRTFEAAAEGTKPKVPTALRAFLP